MYMGFDHVGLADTGRYWRTLHDRDRTPQIFGGNLMIRKIDTVLACNIHEHISGSFNMGYSLNLNGKCDREKNKSRKRPEGTRKLDTGPV